MTGLVSLVGAGPGDPELLTLRAARRLQAADLVLYDALVGAGIVALAPHAQCFCVGKRAGAKAVSQTAIHRLLIRGARQGKRVVRLKCGDPFVLGRGGEEALAVCEAGVPFEVVPGVSSVVAAPALAGVPLTHRGLASGFLVVSGHSEAVFGPLLDMAEPHALTVVVLMGVATRQRIAARLLARGWRPRTRATVVLAAGTPDMRTWSGRLDELGGAALDLSGRPPGTIVVGDVAGLRSLTAAARTHGPAAAAVGGQLPLRRGVT